MQVNFRNIDAVFKLIDEYNSQDPNIEIINSEEYPKELLYAERMSACLDQFAPEASPALKIATRAQHIGRWQIPRSEFPQDRKGYLQWRNKLKELHAQITAQILTETGFNQTFTEEVCELIRKKDLRINPDTQTLEDVICLVFLQYYLQDFADSKDEEKVVDILRKTWRKMSEKGRSAALKLSLTPRVEMLIKSALG